jgi:hypothetical protein
VTISEVSGEPPIEVSVFDNGCGMDPFTLRQALRFGGSSRFGDRGGLGRYGMGLPNSSLSQAGRVVVYTWQTLAEASSKRARDRDEKTSKLVYSSYLDVDEIARGELQHVPVPRVVSSPPAECRGRSGTYVVWQRCDRLDNRRISTLERKLASDLGRRFRHFIWRGVQLTVNGTAVEPIDPLYLNSRSRHRGAKLFGDELKYELLVDPSDPAKGSGVVKVRFTELPVHEWHSRSNDEKKALGVSKGAGVSVVRAGREVDYGWFFMGEKRRENYDDWWRCEVQFEPLLDEAFGITHTKQQIRAKGYVLEALTPDLEATARVLNARVRKAHFTTKTHERSARTEEIASDLEHRLPPITVAPDRRAQALMAHLKRLHPSLRPASGKQRRYAIVETPLRETAFFSVARDRERLVLVINPEHPFYAKVYRPLADSDSPRDKELRTSLELMLLAASRCEAATDGRRAESLSRFRLEWSNTLATFLNG